MQHLLLVSSQLRPLDLILYLFEMLCSYHQHLVILLWKKKQGQVGELLRQGHLHEVHWLLETEAGGGEAQLECRLCKVVDVFLN
jgi:hypothetical protein